MTCQRIDGSDSSSHSVTSRHVGHDVLLHAADMRHPLTPAMSAPRRRRFPNDEPAPLCTSALLDARMSDANVTTYLLDRLAEAGVDRLFGVPGDFTLAMLDDVEGTARSSGGRPPARRPGTRPTGMHACGGSGPCARRSASAS